MDLRVDSEFWDCKLSLHAEGENLDLNVELAKVNPQLQIQFSG